MIVVVDLILLKRHPIFYVFWGWWLATNLPKHGLYVGHTSSGKAQSHFCIFSTGHGRKKKFLEPEWLPMTKDVLSQVKMKRVGLLCSQPGWGTDPGVQGSGSNRLRATVVMAQGPPPRLATGHSSSHLLPFPSSRHSFSSYSFFSFGDTWLQ